MPYSQGRASRKRGSSAGPLPECHQERIRNQVVGGLAIDLAGCLTWPSSRVATEGESTASPRAAARTPRSSSSGGESLSR